MRSLATLCLCKHEVTGPAGRGRGGRRSRYTLRPSAHVTSMQYVRTLRVFFFYRLCFKACIRLGQSHVTKTSQDGWDFRHPILFTPKEFLVDVAFVGRRLVLPCFSCSNPFVTYLPPPSAMCVPSRPTFVARCRSDRGDTVAAAASVVAPFRPSNWFVKGERARNTV